MKAQVKPMASQAQVKIIEDILCAKCHRPAAHLTDHGITIQSRHSGANDISLLTPDMLRYCVAMLEKRQRQQAANSIADGCFFISMEDVSDCCVKTFEREKWPESPGATLKSSCCGSYFLLQSKDDCLYVWTPLPPAP